MHKALRGLEIGVSGLDPTFEWDSEESVQAMRHELANPGPRRLWCVADAFRSGMSIDEVFQVSKIDSWFLAQIEDLVWDEARLTEMALSDLDRDSLWRLKRKGFSDKRLAVLLDVSEKELRERRLKLDLRPVYKRVDTCAGEFATPTAYLYSTYEEECEANPSSRDKIMVLGGGPNRIGQGGNFSNVKRGTLVTT